MSPILGIIDSSKTGNLAVGAYDSIATYTVGAGGSSTIVFSSIPQTYKHLEFTLTIFGNSYGIASTQNGAGSREHYLSGTGSGAGSTSNNTISYVPDDSSSSTVYPYVVFGRILDYTNPNKYKSVRDYEGFGNNTGGEVLVNTALLDASTAAITSLTFTAAPSGVFAQYSVGSLYGIKG
jgi:hypothetical protein